MNAFLYHNGALGDFITTIPSILLWKKITSPESITFFGNRKIGEFAVKSGIVDTVWDSTKSCYVSLFSSNPDRSLANFSNFLLFTSPDSELLKNISQTKPEYLFYQKPFPEKPVHIVDYHISLFSRYKDFDIPLIPQIRIPDTGTYFSCNNKYICIAPGSGSSIKNWPLSRFIETADYLKCTGYSIVWICGPAEDNLTIPDNDTILRNADLLQIAAVLSKCELYIGNDSGITHLAAATGCNILALFGPSDPTIWSPRGLNVKILQKPSICPPCHLTINSTTIP